MTLAPCEPCGMHTRHLGPYFLPVGLTPHAPLYAHYQCLPCGRVRIPFAKNPVGELVALSYVEPGKVRR